MHNHEDLFTSTDITTVVFIDVIDNNFILQFGTFAEFYCSSALLPNSPKEKHSNNNERRPHLAAFFFALSG